MISDQDAEAAVDYLRDTSDAAAHARADRLYMEEYRKSLKAELMKEHLDKAVNAQEREAYADARYLSHLEAMRTAIFNDEKHRFLLEAAKAKIEAWRTLQASARAMP